MSAFDVSCSRCNSSEIRTQRVPLPNGGHHIKPSCASCDRFLKFIPHDGPKFPFGKHKGLTVVEVAANDPSYLEWCLSKNIIKNSRLRDAVEWEVVTA